MTPDEILQKEADDELESLTRLKYELLQASATILAGFLAGGRHTDVVTYAERAINLAVSLKDAAHSLAFKGRGG